MSLIYAKNGFGAQPLVGKHTQLIPKSIWMFILCVLRPGLFQEEVVQNIEVLYMEYRENYNCYLVIPVVFLGSSIGCFFIL